MSLHAQKSHEERAELFRPATKTRKAIQYVFIAYAHTAERNADYIAFHASYIFAFMRAIQRGIFIENKTLCNLSFNQILFVSLHLKNHQNFKGDVTDDFLYK